MTVYSLNEISFKIWKTFWGKFTQSVILQFLLHKICVWDRHTLFNLAEMIAFLPVHPCPAYICIQKTVGWLVKYLTLWVCSKRQDLPHVSNTLVLLVRLAYLNKKRETPDSLRFPFLLTLNYNRILEQWIIQNEVNKNYIISTLKIMQWLVNKCVNNLNIIIDPVKDLL